MLSSDAVVDVDKNIKYNSDLIIRYSKEFRLLAKTPTALGSLRPRPGTCPSGRLTRDCAPGAHLEHHLYLWNLNTSSEPCSSPDTHWLACLRCCPRIRTAVTPPTGTHHFQSVLLRCTGRGLSQSLGLYNCFRRSPGSHWGSSCLQTSP